MEASSEARAETQGEALGQHATGPSPAAAGGDTRTRWNMEALLKMGSSLQLLAIAVIIVLSAGLGAGIYSEIREHPFATFGDSDDVLRGFVYLMVITIGYMVVKRASTTRDQKRVLRELLDDEVITRALQVNPVIHFHHPDVCRDILIQQASHAARHHAPLSVLELTISDLEDLPFSRDAQARASELVRQIKRLCRSSDGVLRWSPNSFVILFPEVTREELLKISHRLREQLEFWLEERLGAKHVPVLRWRGITSTNLDTAGDILLETQRLLDSEPRDGAPQGDKAPKSVALVMEMELRGADCLGNFFKEKIVTERVAADRVWFVCKRGLVENTPVTVIGPEGSFEQNGTIVRLTERNDEQLAEVQFEHPPANWVVRA